MCIAVKTAVYKFSRVSLMLKLITYLLDHMRKCVLCLYHVIFSICLLIFSIHEHLAISYSHLKEACMVVEKSCN